VFAPRSPLGRKPKEILDAVPFATSRGGAGGAVSPERPLAEAVYVFAQSIALEARTAGGDKGKTGSPDRNIIPRRWLFNGGTQPCPLAISTMAGATMLRL
jgi:hypothetical protein